MKRDDPFAEDKGLMSPGVVSDYGFVFSKWVPTSDWSSSTDWSEVGNQIEFQAIVRTRRGELRAVVRMPRLETKAGAKAFTAEVRKRLADELKKAGL